METQIPASGLSSRGSGRRIPPHILGGRSEAKLPSPQHLFSPWAGVALAKPPSRAPTVKRHFPAITKFFLTLSLLVGLWLPGTAADPVPEPADPYANETRAERDARMKWWREAKFGLFITWGVYGVPAGTWEPSGVTGGGEWLMHGAKIPVAKYKPLACDFNPTRYDPAAWARLAAEAGMKYIVITAKHHDGFALYDSAVTDWDVAGATPHGKDLLAPLVREVKSRGLKVGFYYSQAQDWVHLGGAKMRYDEGDGWDPAHRGDFDRYLREIAVPQTREILGNYEIDVLWWDTPVWMNDERARRFLPLLRLRPGIIHNDRLGGSFGGDTITPENFVPATGIPGKDWETCMTMNGSWGYDTHATDWKSSGELIRTLVDIVSKGGNFLLNIGPRPDGTIQQEAIDRLRAIGAWMKVNGEAIHATTASPCGRPAWGRITTRKSDHHTRLYLHVFKWPAAGTLTVPLHNKVLNASLLADPDRRFSTRATDEGLELTLTGTAPNPPCPVVILDVSGPPDPAVLATRQAPDGSLTFQAADALIHNGNYGGQARHVEDDSGGRISHWHDARIRLEWPVWITTPGTFDVILEAAAPADGCRLTLEVGGRKLTATVPVAPDGAPCPKIKIGTLVISETGPHTLAVRPLDPGWKPVTLRSILFQATAPGDNQHSKTEQNPPCARTGRSESP